MSGGPRIDFVYDKEMLLEDPQRFAQELLSQPPRVLAEYLFRALQARAEKALNPEPIHEFIYTIISTQLDQIDILIRNPGVGHDLSSITAILDSIHQPLFLTQFLFKVGVDGILEPEKALIQIEDRLQRFLIQVLTEVTDAYPAMLLSLLKILMHTRNSMIAFRLAENMLPHVQKKPLVFAEENHGFAYATLLIKDSKESAILSSDDLGEWFFNYHSWTSAWLKLVASYYQTLESTLSENAPEYVMVKGGFLDALSVYLLPDDAMRELVYSEFKENNEYAAASYVAQILSRPSFSAIAALFFVWFEFYRHLRRLHYARSPFSNDTVCDVLEQMSSLILTENIRDLCTQVREVFLTLPPEALEHAEALFLECLQAVPFDQPINQAHIEEFTRRVSLKLSKLKMLAFSRSADGVGCEESHKTGDVNDSGFFEESLKSLSIGVYADYGRSEATPEKASGADKVVSSNGGGKRARRSLFSAASLHNLD